MQAKTKRVIQAVLIVAFLAAGIRLYVILSGRGAEGPEKPSGRPVDTGLERDAYVVPKRLRAYDLKSAQALAGKPVWMREGYRYTTYPYDPATRRADFDTEAGTLGPIERIEVKEVREQATPGRPGQKQVLAIFEKDDKSYALPIGRATGREYNIYADEALFIEDPHELYRHWPAEVWQAVEQHQVKPGMNEIQASFAVGMGTPFRSDDPDVKTVEYPNAGKKLTVTYHRGKATRIDAGS
jgi:hypothetical protein